MNRVPRDLGASVQARLRNIATERGDDVPDGITFVPDALTIARIREDQSYEGWRVTLRAEVGTARLNVQVDIGFGDAVHPPPELLPLPALLGMPAPTLLTYPRETVVAEKLEALVSLGLVNSRMKDFFDLHFLGMRFSFDGEQLAQAVRGTFTRRRTTLPTELPVGLSKPFADDADKRVQWRAFLRRTGLGDGLALGDVIRFLRGFRWPVVATTRDRPTPGDWPAGGPWRDQE